MLRHRKSFLGHTHCVYSVAVSPCGRYLASGSLDKSIRIWELQRNRQLYRFVEGTDSVRLVGWLDTERLYATSYSPVIRVYRPLDGTLANIMHDVSDIQQITADAQTGDWMLTLNRLGSLGLWNSRRCRKTSELHAQSPRRITCFFRIPSRLACFVASNNDQIGEADFEDSGEPVKWKVQHTGSINCLVLNHDQSMLAVGDDEGTVSFYQPRDFECLRKLVGSGGWILTMCFNPDDSQIVVAGQDTAVCVWSTKTFQRLCRTEAHRNWVACVNWSEPRWVISSGQDSSIQLYERANTN